MRVEMEKWVALSRSHWSTLSFWGSGEVLYSLVGGTMALPRVDASCTCPVPQNRAPGSFQCALNTLGLYCQIHDRPGLSSLPCGCHAPRAGEEQ